MEVRQNSIKRINNLEWYSRLHFSINEYDLVHTNLFPNIIQKISRFWVYNCIPEYLFQINETVTTRSSKKKNYNSNAFQKNTLKSLLNSKIKWNQNILTKKFEFVPF